MPRVVKHPDIRRAELLDLAAALFVQHGYDKVSLNDLIAAAGVSKGAFYHWFPSKEALVTALADKAARDGFTMIEAALKRCSGDALERLNTVLQAGFDAKMNIGAPELLAASASLLRPGNAHLYAEIVAAEENCVRPLLARLVSEGVSDSIFDTFDPDGVADMICGLAARTNTNILAVLDAPDELARESAIDALTTRFQLHGLAIDRVLGLPDGSIARLTRAQVETMVAAFPGAPG